MELNGVCPVCGSKKGTGSMEENGITCTVCGFPYAYVRCFAGETSIKKWRSLVKEAKVEIICKMGKACIERHVFYLHEKGVVFRFPYSGKIKKAGRVSALLPECNILEYSATERNEAWLMSDGTVNAVGENDYMK